MEKNEIFGFGKIQSVDSTSSEYQYETGRFTNQIPEKNQNDTLIQFGEYLFDCVAVFLICPRHRTIALSQASPNKGLWFPICPIKTGQAFTEAIFTYLKQILLVPNVPSPKNYLSFRYPQIINIMRLQMPQYFEFVMRILFFTELSFEEGFPNECCINNALISWHMIDSISELLNLWGPEPINYLNSYQSEALFHQINYFEITIKELVNYISEIGTHQEMLRACGCNEKEILNLYSEFVQHTYPSQFMNFYSFCDFLSKSGLSLANKDDLVFVFRSFAFSFNVNFINFYEFIIGLSAMDKLTAHGGRIGEIRVGYIFRYYNNSGTPFLAYNDIKLFVRDLMALKNASIEENSLERELVQTYNLLGVPYKSPVSCKVFARAVGSLQIRGTSGLFRAQQSPLAYLRTKSCYKEIQLLQLPTSKLNQGAIGIKMNHIKGICLRCKEKQYTLAAHYVKVLQDGTIVEPHEIKGQADVYRMPKPARRLSDLSFYANNICNVLIDMIRLYFENPQTSLWSIKQHRFDMVDKILKLFNEAETLFTNETRVVKVNSPVYVLGDIHGNLHDLMVYEKTFWKMGPACLTSGYLFLGDYVDRGQYSVECMLYLLCAKLLTPNRFTLLRGNHELRSVQQQFTFYRECVEKFEKFGIMIWENFNKVFDVMPLCAIIDEQVYCAHGGIPTSVTKIEQLISSIPCPLMEPESQSQCAWEVLWNDPISNKEYDEYMNLLRSQNITTTNLNPGFLPNTKRGTAYYFAEDAVNNFLASNGFSHVIRAHEVVQNGFQCYCGGRVITVFSSSKYCGGFNESAVILVDLNKIRIMKVDTN